MATKTVLLPGETIPQELIPTRNKPSKTLKVGPGLRFTPPDTITSSVSGILSVDARKHSLWVETNGQGRYTPTVGDQVVVTVLHSTSEFYHCSLSPHAAPALLPQLSFESASRKTRPQLHTGSIVYARVAAAPRYADVELECVHPTTGKADGLGELKGGCDYHISLGMARRLLKGKPREDGGIGILEGLGTGGLAFEVAVGRNGHVWVKGESVRSTAAIGMALLEVDTKGLALKEQDKLARSVLKSLT